MICSCLIPSRFRPDGLIKAINSLHRQSSNLHQIEFIIRLDNDDEESLRRQDEFRKFPNVTILVGLRVHANEMCKEMVRHAKGLWILVFNDDATIHGLNWDALLLGFPTTGVILQPDIYKLNESEYFHADRTGFPFFPNGCWEEFGYEDFLPHPCDYAVVDLAERRGWKIRFLPGVTIHHERKEP